MLSTASPSVHFKIANMGIEDLEISEAFSSDPDQFTIEPYPLEHTTISSGCSITLDVRFKPQHPEGLKTATITINSNDPDENSYTFTVVGYGTLDPGINSEINVIQGHLSIPAGSVGYNFGSVSFASEPVTFTIQNGKRARDVLVIEGIPSLTSGDTDDFIIDIDYSIFSSKLQPGETTPFSIAFKPTSAGPKSATVSIYSNDQDKNPFEFVVRGLGTVADIDMQIIDYPDGTIYTFGYIYVSKTKTFTIKNLGTETLHIKSILLVDGGPDYTLNLTSPPTSFVLGPDKSTTFDVSFTPQGYGLKTADIYVNSNDPGSPYNLHFWGYKK
jgi:hypothetical protein